MLTKVDTNEFVIYTQTLLEVKEGDEYNRLKKIKQRAKVIELFDRILPHKEMIISWKEDDGLFSVTATCNTHGFNNLAPLIEIPEEFDEVNGNKVPGQKHISFYARPSMVPVLIKVDDIEAIIVSRVGLEPLLAK